MGWCPVIPLAQFAVPGSILYYLIIVIVIAAVIGIVFVALRQFGVSIPPWAVQIFWICVVAVVAIIAIKFVIGLL